MYNDGHEREDVKRYRDQVFLPRMAAYRDEFLRWDENHQEIPNDLHLTGVKQPLILVTQDECTFNANDGKHFLWIHPDHQPLTKKGRGQGLHVSDFLTPIGRLGNGDACVIMKCGGDTWWTGDTSAKNILPHVLHTYLPVSPGNTISPYTPHASHFSVLF